MKSTIHIIDGTQYVWSGWFGCQLESIESYFTTIKQGDCRYILNRVFYAYRVDRYLTKFPRVSWCMVLPKEVSENLDSHNAAIRSLKSDLGQVGHVEP